VETRKPETTSVASANQPASAPAVASATLPPALLQPQSVQSLRTGGPIEQTTANEPASRGPVLPAQRPKPLEEWQVMLGATIRSLEQQLGAGADSALPPSASEHKTLRLLYVAAGRREDALQPIAELPAAAQQFWNEWCFGTSVCLEELPTGDEARQSTIAARHLRDAIAQLGQQCNLEVRNLSFCRRVTSFGVYDKFTAERPAGTLPTGKDEHLFAPDQEVLIYAEIANFASRQTDKGYHTELRASYQILDAQGRRVGPIYDLGVSHDYCQQRRTDFFVRFHRHLPTGLPPGQYSLTLTIEDVQSNKVGESSVPFTIR
jgi:hypothetical protein